MDFKFNPGDIVQLKSGGPKMTVGRSWVSDQDNITRVACGWYEWPIHQYKDDTFYEPTLILYDESAEAAKLKISKLNDMKMQIIAQNPDIIAQNSEGIMSVISGEKCPDCGSPERDTTSLKGSQDNDK